MNLSRDFHAWYEYPHSLFAPGYVFGGGGFCLAIWLLVAVQNLPVEVPALVYFVLIMGAAMNVGIALGPVLLLRPLRTDDEKITAYLFGRPFKTLVWKDVVLIEKIRTYNSYKRKYWFIYFIRAPKTKIRFQDGLRDLEALIREVNQQASRHQIPLEYVDRGADSRSMAAANAGSRDERKRVFWDGVRTRVEGL